MFGIELEKAVRNIPGGQAAILMGIDGIPVDQYAIDKSFDVETVGMEFSVILKDVKKTVSLLDSGVAEEFTLGTDRMTTVIRWISDEYFIAITIDPNGNVGKARYILRILVPQLRQELL